LNAWFYFDYVSFGFTLAFAVHNSVRYLIWQKRGDNMYLTVFYVLTILIMLLKLVYVYENLQMVPLTSSEPEWNKLFKTQYYVLLAGFSLKTVLGVF